MVHYENDQTGHVTCTDGTTENENVCYSDNYAISVKFVYYTNGKDHLNNIKVLVHNLMILFVECSLFRTWQVHRPNETIFQNALCYVNITSRI